MPSHFYFGFRNEEYDSKFKNSAIVIVIINDFKCLKNKIIGFIIIIIINFINSIAIVSFLHFYWRWV